MSIVCAALLVLVTAGNALLWAVRRRHPFPRAHYATDTFASGLLAAGGASAVLAAVGAQRLGDSIAWIVAVVAAGSAAVGGAFVAWNGILRTSPRPRRPLRRLEPRAFTVLESSAGAPTAVRLAHDAVVYGVVWPAGTILQFSPAGELSAATPGSSVDVAGLPLKGGAVFSVSDAGDAGRFTLRAEHPAVRLPARGPGAPAELLVCPADRAVDARLSEPVALPREQRVRGVDLAAGTLLHVDDELDDIVAVIPVSQSILGHVAPSGAEVRFPSWNTIRCIRALLEGARLRRYELPWVSLRADVAFRVGARAIAPGQWVNLRRDGSLVAEIR